MVIMQSLNKESIGIHYLMKEAMKYEIVIICLLDPPRCDGRKEKFIAKVVGSTVLIPCEVRGNPPPTIEWTLNGKKVIEGRFTTTTKGLTIKALRRGDSGSYQVTLTSVAGTYAHVTELIVKSKY